MQRAAESTVQTAECSIAVDGFMSRYPICECIVAEGQASDRAHCIACLLPGLLLLRLLRLELAIESSM